MRNSLRSTVIGLCGIFILGAGFLCWGRWGGVPAASDAALQAVSLHIIGAYNNFLYQYRYLDGAYQNSWSSATIEDATTLYKRTGSGDLDNDGALEVFVVTNNVTRTEKIDRKTTQKWYRQNLLVFETGAPFGGPRSWAIDDLEGEETTLQAGDCIVADADGVAGQELVVLHSSHVDVYDFTGGVKTVKGRSPSFGQIPRSVDVGDADNDGNNEIVVAIFVTGAPYVLEFNGATFSEQLAEPLPSQYYGKGFSSLNLNLARVRDSDNDGKNEIVCAGNNLLIVWGNSAGTYSLEFVSSNLGDFAFGVDAGDIDGDQKNEIVIGNAGSNRTVPYLWIFAYDDFAKTYVVKSKARTPGMMMGIEIGDLDNDQKDEVVVSDRGLWIYDFVGDVLGAGALTQTFYSETAGSVPEIR